MNRIDRHTHHTALSPLSELDDYDVAEGSPDIRGWTVFDESGREIGEVADLLVDTTTAEALYATVDLDDGETAEVPLAVILLDEAVEGVRLTRPLDTGAGDRAASFEAPATAEYADTSALADRGADPAADPARFEDAERGPTGMASDDAVRNRAEGDRTGSEGTSRKRPRKKP